MANENVKMGSVVIFHDCHENRALRGVQIGRQYVVSVVDWDIGTLAFIDSNGNINPAACPVCGNGIATVVIEDEEALVTFSLGDKIVFAEDCRDKASGIDITVGKIYTIAGADTDGALYFIDDNSDWNFSIECSRTTGTPPICTPTKLID